MRRRWGYVTYLAMPSGGVERHEWASRYWTRSGAQRAADEFMAEARAGHPAIADRLRTEVKKLGPARSYYADELEDLR